MPNVDVFVGPSWIGPRYHPGCNFLPPAQLGDLAKSKAGIVVFLDGVFLRRPSPNHRELLSIINRGQRVIGASSQGALRAVELETFGMIAVGQICEWIRVGDLIDDSDLAVLMNEDTLEALTVAMVNITAACRLLETQGEDRELLTDAHVCASKLYFAERTLAQLRMSWNRISPTLARKLIDVLIDPLSNLKASDARHALDVALSM